MERRSERLRPLDPRQPARASRPFASASPRSCRPRRSRYWRRAAPRRQVLRHQGPAAQAAAVSRRHRLARRPVERARAGRSQRDRQPGRHGDRPGSSPSPDGKLVAVSLVQGRRRGGRRHRLRRRHRQAGRRGDPARQHRHRRRRPGVGARRLGLLLHPPSPRGRAAGRGHELLPAGLLPQARHADGRRPLRAGQGLAADRRDRAEDRRRARAACWPRSRTATAASSPTTCASPTASGGSSASSRTRSSRPSSARTTTCTSCRGRTRRAARSCACRSTRSTWPAAEVVVPEGEDAIVTSFWQHATARSS